MDISSEGIMSSAVEDVIIIGGLIGVQFVYAGNAVLMSFLMALGLSSLTIVIYTSLSTFLVLLPFAIYFERHQWPRKFSVKFIIQLLLLSFGGVTLFQSLFIKGISLTSPAMGTAMPNLAPGLIFIIAWISGLEKVELSCGYSKVKIIGTMVCVIGAFSMSLMQSLTTHDDLATQASSSSSSPNSIFDSNKITGSLYLIAAVFMLSSNVVLQAFTLGDFPAPMTLSALTSLLGAITTIIAQLLQQHSFNDSVISSVNFKTLASYSFLAGGLGGISLSFNGWALKKRGPVFVSVFSPIATVCSVLSSFTLGYSTNIGSMGGMFLMFVGLYFVLWAKGKEGYSHGQSEFVFDTEKPLLN